MEMRSLFFVGVVTAVFVAGCTLDHDDRTAEVEFTMVNVSGDRHSGDALLMEFPDGHVTLIDTGFERYTIAELIPLIKRRGITAIDELIITHAHRNHYEGMLSLLEAVGGRIGAIYFNLPAREACDAEKWPSGCRWDHLVSARQKAKDAGVLVREAEAGDVIYQDRSRNISLKVLFAFDGADTPVGGTDINDTSLIMRLEVGDTSVLLPGDLNKRLGAWIAKQDADLSATILKAPHHGVESAAPNSFLDRVAAEVALVPVSAPPWQGERGERMRRYFESRGVPVFVNGLHGHVTVRLRPDGYLMETEP